MLAKLYTCYKCGENVAEGVDITFVFVEDVESVFIGKRCLMKIINDNRMVLRFAPSFIKKLLKKYGLFG